MKMFKAPMDKMQEFFKKFKEYKQCCKVLNEQNKLYNKEFNTKSSNEKK
jgi:hypothetical protein